MYELMTNGEIIGVFTSELAAQQYALTMKIKSYQIFPLGNYLATDYETR
jgi:hypothetical protein